MKILICGARDFDDKIIIDNFIMSLSKNTVIIEGEAKGADSLARDHAIKHGLEVEKYPVTGYDKYGRAAPIFRNTRMLKEGKPDYIVGYSKDIKSSRGTKNMLTQGIKAEVPCYSNVSDFIDIQLCIGQMTLEDLK